MKNIDMDDVTFRDENMLISYDSFIQIPEFFIFNNIIRKDSNYKKFLKLDTFEYINDKSMQPLILQRNEKSLLKWIIKDEFKTQYSDEDLNNMYKTLYNKYDDMYTKLEITNFANGLIKLLKQSSIKQVTFNFDKDDRKVNKLLDIYSEFTDKIKINTDPLDKILKEKNEYTVIMHDNDKVLKNYIDNNDVSGKSFILPYFGYLFTTVNNIMISKYEFELMTKEKDCSVGFMNPMKFDESYFVMG